MRERLVHRPSQPKLVLSLHHLMIMSHTQTSRLDGAKLLQSLQWRSRHPLTFPRRGEFSTGLGCATVLVQELRTAADPRAVTASRWVQTLSSRIG